jgi:flagellar motility protein MotE (MotC chaperone)
MSITKRHPRPSRPKGSAPTGQKPRSPAKKKARRRGPIVRVLPLLILTAVFVLGFRVTVVVNDVQTLMASVDVSQPGAFAQEGAGARVEDATPPADQIAQAQTAETQTDAAQSTMAPAGDDMTGAEPAANPEDNVGVLETQNQNNTEFGADPQTFTQSELELLQRLSERRKVIEAQAQENKAREAMLRAAEARIDGKIAELQQLEQTLSDLVAEADGQQKAKIDQLVRIYGAMKPKDAARIFNDLDMPILLTVVESMKENKVAPILADMDAMKATAVTEALSMRKLIPGIDDDPQG